MSTPRNNLDPLLKEILATSIGEEMDVKILDLAMKIVERMFLGMKEEDAKKKAKEEESRRIAEEDKGKGKMEYIDDLVELLVSKVMSKVSLNAEVSPESSDKPSSISLVIFSVFVFAIDSINPAI
jgi:CHASE3 domain sensor protein